MPYRQWPSLLPLDKDAEAKRSAAVEEQFGKVAPGVSLVTVSALIASGQGAHITYHPKQGHG